MNRCGSRGLELPGTPHVWPHHHTRDPAWAPNNCISSDLLHRGGVPMRLRAPGRDEELRGCLR